MRRGSGGGGGGCCQSEITPGGYTVNSRLAWARVKTLSNTDQPTNSARSKGPKLYSGPVRGKLTPRCPSCAESGRNGLQSAGALIEQRADSAWVLSGWGEDERKHLGKKIRESSVGTH